MTLVVARTIGGKIGIISDTQLFQNDTTSSFQEGVIKSCILPGGMCVSFANSPELAARSINQFVNTFPDGANFSNSVNFLCQSSFDTGNEYILSFAKTGKILKISDGKPR